MNNKYIITLALFFALTISFVSASEVQLLCLGLNETVEFSSCNPLIDDRTCTSPLGCQYCVSYNSNTGVYCPASLNSCNSMPDIECSYLSSNNITNSSNNSTNSTNSTGTENNSTNSSNNNSSFNFTISPKLPIAYILKDPNNPVNNVISILNQSGYNYSLIDDDNLPGVNFSNYSVIIVMDEKIKYPELVPITKQKSLISNTYHLKTWKIAYSAGSSVSSQYANGRIINSSSSIVQGMNSPIRLYTATSRELNWLARLPKRSVSVNNILGTDNSYQDVVIGSLENNSKLYPSSAGNVSAKTVFFGITQANYWSPESKVLFKNSLNWLYYGEDSDNDGFTSENECNDNNPNIYPGANEIAYDGIDQDCNGFDLRDVDGDGYDSSEVGGLDCNDYDPEINPNNQNEYENCINDAPSIVDLEYNLSLYEGEILYITIYAEDPENNTLSYYINDSRFVWNDYGDVAKWVTNYSDAGDYTFKVTVSDGQYNISQDITIEVIDRNQPPASQSIPDVIWDEDNISYIKLDNYFTEFDNQDLQYGVYNTSNNTEIIVNVQENGIVNFSSIANWSGNDWIQFYAYDGEDIAISNVVNLTVNPVNDAPYLISEIQNVSFVEDNIYSLNMSQYFNDIDSDLDYQVYGLENVSFEVSDDILTFVPDLDYFGNMQLIVNASDGQYSVNSNQFLLNISDAGEPPIFNPINCTTILDEDQEYQCILEATDFENDSMVFSVTQKVNMNCTISDNVLTYSSVKDYNGNGSCSLRVDDKDGNDQEIVNFTISPVNDAPYFVSYSPSGAVNIIEGKNQTFTVSVSDVDSSNLTIGWFIDGVNVSSGSSYNFNKSVGSYNLSASVSDGELNTSISWVVSVGPMSDFTCSQVGGNICNSNTQYCSGSLLGVKDSNMCCNVACSLLPPSFDGADTCDVVNNSLIVKIRNPDSADEFNPGETIRVDVELISKYDDNQNFNVVAQLYDLVEEDVIDENDAKLKLDADDSGTIRIDLVVPDDVDTDNDFGIFVSADDNICNQNYTSVDLERQDDQVILEEFDLVEEASCGDIVELSVKLKNIGSSDQDVDMAIDSSNLDIDIDEILEIESFGDKDDVKKDYLISIPDDVKSGNYTVRLLASYEAERLSETKKISISCDEEEDISTDRIVDDNSLISLNSVSQENKEEGNLGTYILFGLGIFSIVLVIVLVWALMSNSVEDLE